MVDVGGVATAEIALTELGAMQRQQKITLGEMRSLGGPTRLIVYFGVVIDAARWGDDVRLSDLEPKFTCQVCGHRGADVKPLFEHVRMGTGVGRRVDS